MKKILLLTMLFISSLQLFANEAVPSEIKSPEPSIPAPATQQKETTSPQKENKEDDLISMIKEMKAMEKASQEESTAGTPPIGLDGQPMNYEKEKEHLLKDIARVSIGKQKNVYAKLNNVLFKLSVGDKFGFWNVSEISDRYVEFFHIKFKMKERIYI